MKLEFVHDEKIAFEESTIANTAFVKCQIESLGKTTRFINCVFYECYSLSGWDGRNVVEFYNCEFYKCGLTVKQSQFKYCTIDSFVCMIDNMVEFGSIELPLKCINLTIISSKVHGYDHHLNEINFYGKPIFTNQNNQLVDVVIESKK